LTQVEFHREALQLANALTEKWPVAEVARRRVQDLETLVELSTDALQRSKKRSGGQSGDLPRGD